MKRTEGGRGITKRWTTVRYETHPSLHTPPSHTTPYTFPAIQEVVFSDSDEDDELSKKEAVEKVKTVSKVSQSIVLMFGGGALFGGWSLVPSMTLLLVHCPVC